MVWDFLVVGDPLNHYSGFVRRRNSYVYGLYVLNNWWWEVPKTTMVHLFIFLLLELVNGVFFIFWWWEGSKSTIAQIPPR